MELKDIKGIGPKKIEAFNNAEIYTIKDLVFTFPKDYHIYEEDDNHFFAGENTLISGVSLTNPILTRYQRNIYLTIFFINYHNTKLKCIMFSNDYLRYKLKKGMFIRLYGKYDNYKKEFIISKIFFNEDIKTLVDVDYKIKDVRNILISSSLKAIFKGNIIIRESLPLDLINKYNLLPIKDYLYKSHFPRDKNDVIEVLKRRKYEEFFWYSMRLNALKDLRLGQEKPKRIINDSMVSEFISGIPFELTLDQKKAISVIKNDILSNRVMNRLLQGDVGSGKSIISFIFSLMLISSGYQVALMIPSELLAMQQYNEAIKYFKNFKDIKIELLTSKVKAKDKRDIIERLRTRRIDLLIGTHSLIYDNVTFANLGGVIIDEQHRFGVNQRNKLISKFKGVDALYMTATPIPRSLGLTIFGDLDITSIKEKPKGRIDIITKVITYQSFKPLIGKIKAEIALKHQIYVVVPLVLDSDTSNFISIDRCYDLYKRYLTDAKIGIVHGKLKGEDKEKIMEDFNNGNLDILISTTVIEVGMNVKNATMMVIMDAERFGLATLHQLRGRVGRSNLKSYCFLVTKEKNERLDIIEKEKDGFIIAEEDFKMRGPGDYIGDMQSGFSSLDYSSFLNDINLWNEAKEDSELYFMKYKNNELESKIFDRIIQIEENKAGKIS